MIDRAEPQAGIVCPCGGQYETTHTFRTKPNTVTRHRRCRGCRGRVVTRERVIVARPRPVVTSSSADLAPSSAVPAPTSHGERGT
jgi:hypothetical protein